MEGGRRVRRSAPKRNPLYVLFLCLVAAVFVLLIVTVVLGVKLHATQKALDAATAAPPTEITQPIEQDPVVGGEEPVDPQPVDPDPVPTEDERKVGWLDLTGHKEVEVLPSSVFSAYATYYAAESVNLRGGPGVNYTKILTIAKGTAVKAAAKSGEWTFISTSGKFGWVKSEYLSVDPPKVEATSGSVQTLR